MAQLPRLLDDWTLSWAIGAAERSLIRFQKGLALPSTLEHTRAFWAAKWLRTALGAEGSQNDVPANEWWTAAGSNR